MKKLAIWMISVVLLPQVGLHAQNASEQQNDPNRIGEHGKPNMLGIVLDLERPSDTDILLLRNGDKLTGTILNDSFDIRTSYASLKFNNRRIAGIDLEGGANNIEAIVTVNNNRFSGFINDPLFVFKLQTGPQIEIRREKVLKAIFRLRKAEIEGIPQRQFLVLKNGDFFSGRITNHKFSLATTYAKVPLDLTDAESVTLIGGDHPLTKVILRNKDTIQGVLETEDIEIYLDVGPSISIYQDRIDTIFCKEGYVPVDHKGDIEEGFLGIEFNELNPKLALSLGLEQNSKGLVISRLLSDYPADKAGLKTNDIIIELNGKPVIAGNDFRKRVSAARPGDKVNIGILRAGRRQMCVATLGRRPSQEQLKNQSP